MSKDVDGELDSLRSGYPDFAITSRQVREQTRLEAVRVSGEGALYAIITTDSGELRRELDAALAPVRPGAGDLRGRPPDRTGLDGHQGCEMGRPGALIHLENRAGEA